MSFEYRELATQIRLGGGEHDKSPCRHQTCRHHTKDDEADCLPCRTTGGPCGSGSCPDDPGHPKDDEHRKTLALLRQQLHDSLAAG
jgi:hypothetical protein